MTPRVLVAYATRSGSTAEVAETIARTLREAGCEAEVRLLKEVRDLDGYDALVLGTAIRYAKPLPEVLKFAERHRAALCRLPVAYFAVCGTLKEDTPEHRATVLAYLDALRQIKQPVSVGLFAGAIDYRQLNPVMRWFAAHDQTGAMAEGDWRNWDQIGAWAAELAPRLRDAKPASAGVG